MDPFKSCIWLIIKQMMDSVSFGNLEACILTVLYVEACILNVLMWNRHLQKIFTNGDKVHAAKVPIRLGLEDCFQCIIDFETLNTPQITENNNQWDMPTVNSPIPKTPTICKPSTEAIELGFHLTNADMQRLVRDSIFDGHCL